MTVSEIETNKIKISLTHTEVLSCFGAYEKLYSMTPNIKNTINALLRDVISKHLKTAPKGKLTARINAAENSGCIIILTYKAIIDEEENENLLFSFKNSSDLINGILSLCKLKNNINFNSSLYSYKGGYGLIIEGEKKENLYILNEYSRRSQNLYEIFAFEEYGKLILGNNAVEAMAKAFKEP